MVWLWLLLWFLFWLYIWCLSHRKPNAPTCLELSFDVVRFQKGSSMKAIFAWVLPVTPPVFTSQSLAITVNDVAQPVKSLDTVTTTFSLDVAEGDKVHAELWATNGAGDSTHATVDGVAPTVKVPNTPTEFVLKFE